MYVKSQLRQLSYQFDQQFHNENMKVQQCVTTFNDLVWDLFAVWPLCSPIGERPPMFANLLAIEMLDRQLEGPKSSEISVKI